MSTIEKCCEISKELGYIFEKIQEQDVQPFEKKKNSSSSAFIEQDRKKILKLFNY